MLHDSAADIAARFLSARRSASGLADYPGTLPDTLDAAYAIQDAALAEWGRTVIGWKVGRINPPLSDRFGAGRLAGPIFLQQGAATREAVDMPVFAEGFAAGEAEFLLRIAATPPSHKTSFTMDEAAALIDAVHIGIEIASSPLRTINDLGPTAVISDFGNNNGLLIGPEVSGWRQSGFESQPVTLLIDGVEAGRGTASEFEQGAIGSARFLFELMARRGIALEPGQWISSGAVGGVHYAQAGQVVEARFGDFGTVSVALVPAQAE